ncbi:hypothetical protein [Qipengyuania sp. 902]|uniref:hypothetical protein n=1 Tax=Qipengyuania sp. 902 TaxID=3417565 RepID=UPI003EBA8B4E
MSNIVPDQPTGKYRRVDLPVSERKTDVEKFLGYRMEPVEEDTYSVLGDKFYGRPIVGKPAKGNG